MDVDVASLGVLELRKRLRQLGLPTHGKKAELVERLHAALNAQNVPNETEPESQQAETHVQSEMEPSGSSLLEQEEIVGKQLLEQLAPLSAEEPITEEVRRLVRAEARKRPAPAPSAQYSSVPPKRVRVVDMTKYDVDVHPELVYEYEITRRRIRSRIDKR
jgi:hypothetical protein